MPKTHIGRIVFASLAIICKHALIDIWLKHAEKDLL